MPAIFALILISLSTLCAQAQDSVELRKLTDAVNRARYEGGTNHALTITELNELAQQISALIAKDTLTPKEKAAAYFFRGYARAYITNLQYLEGKKADELLIRQALSDLDQVIADGIEYPQLGARISEALYVAGSVAATDRSFSRAYAYWEKCAALDHAGCLNIMAEARLTGQGNQKVDFRAAIDYHLKVFNTGTRYHCAGAYSAQRIAAIGYFTGTATPQGDEVYWIKKAVDLLDQLAAASNSAQGCELSGVLIDEFLYQLSRGDRQDALLDEASAKANAGCQQHKRSGRATVRPVKSNRFLIRDGIGQNGSAQMLWLLPRHVVCRTDQTPRPRPELLSADSTHAQLRLRIAFCQEIQGPTRSQKITPHSS